jgi:hypothetical protein
MGPLDRPGIFVPFGWGSLMGPRHRRCVSPVWCHGAEGSEGGAARDSCSEAVRLSHPPYLERSLCPTHREALSDVGPAS